MILPLKHKIFNIVSDTAEELNLEAFVVGGYVRDLLLSRNNKDIDFVVVGSGIHLAEEVAKKISPNIEVTQFKNFGTAMFHYQDHNIEFVGARKESYNHDSRNPIVEDATIEEDQNRRDFTINAMAISLRKTDYGQLIDPFGGTTDITNKLIKTPNTPDITFSDDPLRMLRAVRFAAQLGFNIESNAFESIKKNVGRLSILSTERIAEELNKIILSPRPSTGFKILAATNLLKEVLPEADRLRGIDEKEGIRHKDNFYHTIEVLDNISRQTNDLWLRWAALLHDIGKPAVKRFDTKSGWTFHGHEYIGTKITDIIFKRLKLPLGQKVKFVQKMVSLHMRPIVLAQDEVTDSAVRRLLFEAGDDIDSLMLLCDADITSKNQEKVTRFLKNYQLVREKIRDIEEKDHIRNFQPPISGQLIMETFGLSPCKAVGNIKDAIKDAILDGKIENNFDTAWELMLNIASELGYKPTELIHRL